MTPWMWTTSISMMIMSEVQLGKLSLSRQRLNPLTKVLLCWLNSDGLKDNPLACLVTVRVSTWLTLGFPWIYLLNTTRSHWAYPLPCEGRLDRSRKDQSRCQNDWNNCISTTWAWLWTTAERKRGTTQTTRSKSWYLIIKPSTLHSFINIPNRTT
jgi:hypothetical protein